MVAERNHVLFRYTKSHDGLVRAKLLEGYRGLLLADASSVYHELYRPEPGITEWAAGATRGEARSRRSRATSRARS